MIRGIHVNYKFLYGRLKYLITYYPDGPAVLTYRTSPQVHPLEPYPQTRTSFSCIDSFKMRTVIMHK